MHLEPLQRTVVWVNTDEFHMRTKICSTTCAREACTTRYLWLKGHSIAFSQRRYALANFNDDTCSFVAKGTITLNLQASDRTTLPKVNIRSDYDLVKLQSFSGSADLPADSSCFDVKQNVTRTWLFYRGLNHLNGTACCDLQAWIGAPCRAGAIFL